MSNVDRAQQSMQAFDRGAQPSVRATIGEFFDPLCETRRVFPPVVKRIVNASFGQLRLVMRCAPLHQGCDTTQPEPGSCAPAGHVLQALVDQGSATVTAP